MRLASIILIAFGVVILLADLFPTRSAVSLSVGKPATVDSQTILHDECEYVIFTSGNLCTAVHKPTCKNALHQLKSWRDQ